MRRGVLMTAAAVAVLCIVGGTCQSTSRTADEDVIQTTGTVQYVQLEGGFYGIVAEDGTKYDPTNLPDEFEEDGLRVRFRAELKEDVLGFHMWGKIVELLEIQRL